MFNKKKSVEIMQTSISSSKRKLSLNKGIMCMYSNVTLILFIKIYFSVQRIDLYLSFNKLFVM